jgi:hypothetical protein
VIRRLAAIVTVALAASALTACATFDRSDVAAEVDGVELSRADLEALVDNEDIVPQGVQSAGEVSRNVTQLFIVSVVTKDLISDQQRSAAAAQFDAQNIAGWVDVPASIKGVFAHISALNNAGIPDEEIASRLDAAEIYVNPRLGRWNGTIEQLEPMSP